MTGLKESAKAIEIERPHGFLVWKGKQSAIASDERLPAGESLLLVSGGEAFGSVTLSQPAHMTTSEFDRIEWADKHCVRPEERRMWWSDAEILYVHEITDWKGFDESVRCEFEDGKARLKEYRPPTEQEQRLIERSGKLPRQIILTPRAVSLTGSLLYDQHEPKGTDVVMVGAEWRPDEGQFVVPLTPTFKLKLERTLKAVYQTGNDVQYIDEGQSATFDHLPLYSLALVRASRFDIERSGVEPEFKGVYRPWDGKQSTEASMPYTIEDYPEQIEVLPEAARRTWIDTYNAVFEEHGDEDTARQAAWGAVNRDYERGEDGEWGEKQVTKTEGGQEYTADAYLYVPDPEKPSTWKLRIEEAPGQVTRSQLGAAAAALGPGFRGQRVQLPADDRRKAARKLIGEYRKLDTPDEDIPAYLWRLADVEPPEKAKGVAWCFYGEHLDVEIKEVGESHLIVAGEDAEYQVAYLGTKFTPREKWLEVEQVYQVKEINEPEPLETGNTRASHSQCMECKLAPEVDKEFIGTMIGLFPDISFAKRVIASIEGIEALKPEDLHVTLVFLGEAKNLEDPFKVMGILEGLSLENTPLKAKLGGIGRFKKETNGRTPFYASIDCPGLAAFRSELVGRLERAGVDLPSEHDFTPHMTLAYLPAEVATPDVDLPDDEFEFHDVVLGVGEEYTPVPLKLDKQRDILRDTKAGRRLGGEKVGRLREIRESINDALHRLGDLLSWADYEDEEPFDLADLFLGNSSGVMVKEVNGEPWHFSWSANAFKDREGEIFSTAALEQFVYEVSERKDKGYFNFWHIPGTDFARKEFAEIVGRFLVEAGPYLKDEAGRRAVEFFEEHRDGHPKYAPEGWGASVEYRYLPEDRKTGVYKWVWFPRTSTLPRAAAANIWNRSSQEEIVTTLTGQRKDAAVTLFGESFVEKLISDGEKETEQLEQKVDFKGETEIDEKQIREFTAGLHDIAGKIEDDGIKKQVAGVAEGLTEANMKERAATLRLAAGRLDTGDEKTRLQRIATAMAEGGEYPTPQAQREASEEAGEDEKAGGAEQGTDDEVPLTLENVALAVKEVLEVDLEPIAGAILKMDENTGELAKSVTELAGRVEKLEKEEALKAQTDLPRIVVDLQKRASQAGETVVAEDDDLKEQKPLETERTGDGSVASSFFGQK